MVYEAAAYSAVLSSLSNSRRGTEGTKLGLRHKGAESCSVKIKVFYKGQSLLKGRSLSRSFRFNLCISHCKDDRRHG